ncbi:hypothetical protein QTP88_020695 [Uroleucon formosanum]
MEMINNVHVYGAWTDNDILSEIIENTSESENELQNEEEVSVVDIYSVGKLHRDSVSFFEYFSVVDNALYGINAGNGQFVLMQYNVT